MSVPPPPPPLPPPLPPGEPGAPPPYGKNAPHSGYRLSPLPYGTGREPDATEPLTRAWHVTVDALFGGWHRWTRWLILGFSAFLVQCGRGGQGNANMRLPGEIPPEAMEFLRNYGYWVLLAVILLITIVFAIHAALLWVGSRGEFMLLDQLGRDHDEVEVPWKEYTKEGNSLFKLRLVLSAVVFAGAIVLMILAFFILLLPMIQDQSSEFSGAMLLTLLGVSAPFLLVFLVIFFIGVFITNFVVPIMYARRMLVMEATSDAWRLMKHYTGTFLLYLLLRMVVFTVLTMLMLPLACCCCCIMMIPYVNTVLTLPAWVYLAGYSATFMEQFGPEYRIFKYNDGIQNYPPDEEPPSASPRYEPPPPAPYNPPEGPLQ